MTTDPNEGERGDIIERLNELDRYDPKLVPLHRAAVAEITRLRAALAAETERCARVADEVAKTAREEAALFSAKGDYTDANHYNGYADGCEEVAAVIRAGG